MYCMYIYIYTCTVAINSSKLERTRKTWGSHSLLPFEVASPQVADIIPSLDICSAWLDWQILGKEDKEDKLNQLSLRQSKKNLWQGGMEQWLSPKCRTKWIKEYKRPTQTSSPKPLSLVWYISFWATSRGFVITDPTSGFQWSWWKLANLSKPSALAY